MGAPITTLAVLEERVNDNTEGLNETRENVNENWTQHEQILEAVTALVLRIDQLESQDNLDENAINARIDAIKDELEDLLGKSVGDADDGPSLLDAYNSLSPNAPLTDRAAALEMPATSTEEQVAARLLELVNLRPALNLVELTGGSAGAA